MSTILECWKCGNPIADFPKPYSRREVCRSCDSELHVCRMCVDFDAHISDQCREDRAEPPGDKQRSNFCDYFVPVQGAFSGVDPAAGKARDELEALFAGGQAGADCKPNPDPSDPESSESEQQKALRELFGEK